MWCLMSMRSISCCRSGTSASEMEEQDKGRMCAYLVIGQWIGTSFVGMIASPIFKLIIEDTGGDGGRIQVSVKDSVSGSGSLVEAAISAAGQPEPTTDNHLGSSAV